MSLTHEEMDQKIDEHFGFEARDDVEGVSARPSTFNPPSQALISPRD
jgi:hypothetical protein